MSNKEEALAQNIERYQDFLKDYDVKKLVATLFEHGFNINLFQYVNKEGKQIRYKRDDYVSFTFTLGKYEYKIHRRPDPAQRDRTVICLNCKSVLMFDDKMRCCKCGIPKAQLDAAAKSILQKRGFI